MDKRIPIFDTLEIETSSYCNYRCPTCMRQSHVNQKAMAPYFTKSYLDDALITKILNNAIAIGFTGNVCLSHHNEPMLDDRIFDTAKTARELGFSYVFACTNAAVLSPDIIKQADGVFHGLHVATYNKSIDKQNKIKDELCKAFKKTRLIFVGGNHVTTHYSPKPDLKDCIKSRQQLPCLPIVKRMIINFQGKHLLCCDDYYGRWTLGSICDNTVEELWYSEKHQEMVLKLLQPGGRQCDPFCKICPRY